MSQSVGWLCRVRHVKGLVWTGHNCGGVCCGSHMYGFFFVYQAYLLCALFLQVFSYVGGLSRGTGTQGAIGKASAIPLFLFGCLVA